MVASLWSRLEDFRRRQESVAAIQALEDHLSRRPDDARAWVRLAQFRADEGDRSRWASALQELAHVYMERGARTKAEAVVREILRVLPGDETAMELLAELRGVPELPAPLPTSNEPEGAEDVAADDVIMESRVPVPPERAGAQLEEALRLTRRSMATLWRVLSKREVDLERFDQTLEKLEPTSTESVARHARLLSRRAALEAEADLLRDSVTDAEAALAALQSLRDVPLGPLGEVEALGEELAEKDQVISELQQIVNILDPTEDSDADPVGAPKEPARAPSPESLQLKKRPDPVLPPAVSTWLRQT